MNDVIVPYNLKYDNDFLKKMSFGNIDVINNWK